MNYEHREQVADLMLCLLILIMVFWEIGGIL